MHRLSGILTATGVAAGVVLATSSVGARPPLHPAPEEPKYSPWQSNRSSYFVQGVNDAGVIYVRPRMMLGYGAPHWQYVALDAHWIVTNSFTAPYIGWRASLPFLDAMMGVRSVYPYNREVLTPAASHTGGELGLDDDGERSTYEAIDFELSAFAPALHGVFFLNFHPVYVNASHDIHLYEEVLRAVIRPPFIIGTRGGYMLGLGESQTIKAGVVAEYVVTGRGSGANVTRGGPIVLVGMGQHLEFMAAFSAVLDSPDSLGIWHGPYAFAGFTHRWAKRF